MKNFILIVGPQGSGKSTQAKQLAEFLGYQFISTGDLLREKIASGNPVGIKIKELIDAGKLVPDTLIENLLYPIFKNESKGYILDGYPRNLDQFHNFESLLVKRSDVFDKAFYLEVGEGEFMKRLKLRAEIEERSDETDEAIKERLKSYNMLTKPLLTEYEKLGKLIKIDGERSIEDIQADLRTYFKKSSGAEN